MDDGQHLEEDVDFVITSSAGNSHERASINLVVVLPD
jgi:hypothetical protein